MILSRRSSAWLLVALQAIFAGFFVKSLSDILGPRFGLFEGPSWFTILTLLQFGIALLLALFAMWKFELTGVVLLIAMHVICPLLFFTDLTRNPYFTQIVLLNVWVAFIWIVWLWECWQNKMFLFPKTALDWPWALFLLIVTASWGISFWSHEASFYPSMVAEGSRNWIFLFLNWIAVYYLAVTIDEKWRERFIWITIWVGVFASIYGLMQFYGIEQIWQKTLTPFANRPVSTFGNPNFLSSYLLLLIPLLFVYFIFKKESWTVWTSFAFLIICLTGVISTMTRSSWVGTLAAMAMLPLMPIIRETVKKNAKRFQIFAVILALCLIFWPKSHLGGYSPLGRLLEIKNVKQSGGYGPWHQRIMIWSCCWMMVKDHFLFGKGWGLLELFYPYYQGKMLYDPIFRNFRTHANNAHNEFLEIWSQTGLIGMGLYVWLWIVLIYYGVKTVRQFSANQPEKSMLAWALTASAVGMFVDNFFGNVSIHFAVPAMLVWWQVGLLFSLEKSPRQGFKSISPLEWHILPTEKISGKLAIGAGLILFIGGGFWHYCREFQEIRYFNGFKISKTSNFLNQAVAELESAWRWYPREVNTNYELANAYARMAHQSVQAGLPLQADELRKKALWAYLESLRANSGYDEIFFNLGAVQTQMGWTEDRFPSFSVPTPRGSKEDESPEQIHGAIYNYSRALGINPTAEEAYSFLGNVYLQNRSQYRDQALSLFSQATFFFPKNKDFWVNLAYLQIETKNFDGAYASLKNAMTIDPFYELARRNLRALLIQTKKENDPLGELDRNLNQVTPLIQVKNWGKLREICEQMVKVLPDNFQIRFILGNTYFQLQQWQKAEESYQEGLKLDSRNWICLNNLALTYRAQNKNADAKKIYERMIEINPNDAQVKQALQSLPGA